MRSFALIILYDCFMEVIFIAATSLIRPNISGPILDRFHCTMHSMECKRQELFTLSHSSRSLLSFCNLHLILFSLQIYIFLTLHLFYCLVPLLHQSLQPFNVGFSALLYVSMYCDSYVYTLAKARPTMPSMHLVNNQCVIVGRGCVGRGETESKKGPVPDANNM